MAKENYVIWCRVVLERLVWFVAGVIIAVLCRMGAPDKDVVADVWCACDCNWHITAEQAELVETHYELTVPGATCPK